MNSRERVLATLNHQEPDRVPLDCGSTVVTGVGAVAYSRLKRHLGIEGGQAQVYNMMMQIVLPEQWYLDRFEVDVVDLSRVFCEDPDEWVDWDLPEGYPGKAPAWVHLEESDGEWLHRDSEGEVIGKMPVGGYYFDQTYYPMADPVPGDVDDLDHQLGKVWTTTMAVPRPGADDEPGFYDAIERKARRLFEETDYAIVANFNASLFEISQRLFRHDNFFTNLVLDRPRIEAVLDGLTERYIAEAERFLPRIAPYVQVVRVADDLGMQIGPQISPKMFHEVFQPRYKAIYDAIKKHSGAKLFLHSCGSIYDLLPDLIDAGVDIINPVQTSAADMDARRLKDEFGDDLVFWGGGCDSQSVLAVGTPDDVRREVEQKMEIMAPGGGFVFCQVHNIMPETTPENILAMYDAFAARR
ncbi:MAG: methyltransferase [SAR202 cluster bacterium]|jgi:uroporphyrinogen decarboxylase|nr:uroporphyrinogen decarboxylase family protein [SAR202 cluster bacterium]MQG68174.1 methyltransferase [SAR202 cluster bacterium]